MEELEEIEEDAGLGNGGLGRLAGEYTACGGGVEQSVPLVRFLMPTSCTHSLLLGLHGYTGTSCLWIWDPL